MKRAVATGEILSIRMGLPLLAWPDIHEYGGLFSQNTENGDRIGVEGPSRQYFETHHPELLLPQSLGSVGWWNRPHEDLPDMLIRACQVKENILKRHKSKTHRVALITHGGFYNFFLSQLLSVAAPEERTHSFQLNNAAISHINFDESHVRVDYLNRVDFLPRELIT